MDAGNRLPAALPSAALAPAFVRGLAADAGGPADRLPGHAVDTGSRHGIVEAPVASATSLRAEVISARWVRGSTCSAIPVDGYGCADVDAVANERCVVVGGEDPAGSQVLQALRRDPGPHAVTAPRGAVRVVAGQPPADHLGLGPTGPGVERHQMTGRVDRNGDSALAPPGFWPSRRRRGTRQCDLHWDFIRDSPLDRGASRGTLQV